MFSAACDIRLLHGLSAETSARVSQFISSASAVELAVRCEKARPVTPGESACHHKHDCKDDSMNWCQRTTRTSRMLSRERKNLIEAKSRNRFSMWRLLNTLCRVKLGGALTVLR